MSNTGQWKDEAMIFLRYENWKGYLRYYPITSILLAANIIMYVVLLIDGGPNTALTLMKYGALTNIPPWNEEVWRLFASMFLHSGFSHLLFNCFALLVFAPPLERLLGFWRYAILYIGSGLVGNIISQAYYNNLTNPTLSIGASGAIYGVYGAFLYIVLFQRHLMDDASRKTIYTILGFGIIFSLGVANINMAAHLGGLIGGFFLYGLIIRLLKRR
ncbi:Membrane associated serine protease, rhomboid family [Paenibacillus sp. 453mf]|nr:Membrane associated serine protease, rhomboid family [Paenibacillus sp. 453mf]